MKTKMKYLNVAVLLVFMSGQVQYAYSVYFCTMERKAVQMPAASMSMSDESNDDACDACQVIIESHPGQQSIASGCIKVVSIEKATVDNFSSSEKHVQHFTSSALFDNQIDGARSQLSPFNFVPIVSNSPPLDLPTLNSNLRI